MTLFLLLTTLGATAQTLPPDIKVLVPNKNQEIEAPRRIRENLPRVRERDLLFAKAGVENQTETMDQVDKDLLWIDAKTLSIADLKKKYTKIPPSNLAKLQRLAQD